MRQNRAANQQFVEGKDGRDENIAVRDLGGKSTETPAGEVSHLEAGEMLNLAAGEELTALTQEEMTAVCDKLHNFVRLNPDRAEGNDNTNNGVEIAAQMRERNGAAVIAKRTRPASTKRHPLLASIRTSSKAAITLDGERG